MYPLHSYSFKGTMMSRWVIVDYLELFVDWWKKKVGRFAFSSA
jgi:hypothetical protein